MSSFANSDHSTRLLPLFCAFTFDIIDSTSLIVSSLGWGGVLGVTLQFFFCHCTHIPFFVPWFHFCFYNQMVRITWIKISQSCFFFLISRTLFWILPSTGAVRSSEGGEDVTEWWWFDMAADCTPLTPSPAPLSFFRPCAYAFSSVMSYSRSAGRRSVPTMLGPPGALNPRHALPCSPYLTCSMPRRAALCLCISHPFPPADTSPT